MWFVLLSIISAVLALDASRMKFQTDVGACLRAIDQKTAEVGADKARAAGLKQLRRKLAPVPLDRRQFRQAFQELVREDLLAATLMGLLSRANVPVIYYDESSPGLCHGSQIAYFTPGLRREVGMCAHPNELMGRSLIGFIHESLHLFQFGREPVKELLTYPFNGGVRLSARALRYTPHAKYIEFDDLFSRQGQASLAAFPVATRRAVGNLMLALDEIKTLYMMYPKGNRIEFLPKKPWVIPDQRFYAALDEKMVGDTGYESESADLRFSVAELAPKSRRARSADPDRQVKRLSPSWYEWLQRNRQYQGRPRREQLVSYLQDMNAEYEKVMLGLAGNPALRGQVLQLFKTFFVSARIMRGLLNYCAEMQANMQSKMLLYLFYRDLSAVPPCDKVLPSQWEATQAEENIYSAQFPSANDFERIDELMEKQTKRWVSRTQSYGASFSFLYGYENFPNIFSADACANYKDEFLEFRP